MRTFFLFRSTLSLIALIAASTPAVAGTGATQALDNQVADAVERFAPQAVEYRHRIHRNPELGNREFETAAMVAEHLESLGIPVQTGVAHTGVVGILVGGLPGPVIAVRADMDALPVTEDTPYDFRSTKRATYLGQVLPGTTSGGHHTPTFQADDSSIPIGMRVMSTLLLDYLAQAAEGR